MVSICSTEWKIRDGRWNCFKHGYPQRGDGNDRLDKIDMRLNQMDARFDRIDGRFDGIEGRLD